MGNTNQKQYWEQFHFRPSNHPKSTEHTCLGYEASGICNFFFNFELSKVEHWLVFKDFEL